ncbi:MAG: hypothetical protein V1912_06345 [bacterium]
MDVAAREVVVATVAGVAEVAVAGDAVPVEVAPEISLLPFGLPHPIATPPQMQNTRQEKIAHRFICLGYRPGRNAILAAIADA